MLGVRRLVLLSYLGRSFSEYGLTYKPSLFLKHYDAEEHDDAKSLKI